jgi:hypothetical protein
MSCSVKPRRTLRTRVIAVECNRLLQQDSGFGIASLDLPHPTHADQRPDMIGVAFERFIQQLFAADQIPFANPNHSSLKHNGSDARLGIDGAGVQRQCLFERPLRFLQLWAPVSASINCTLI